MNSKKNYITAMLALTAMATTAPAQQQRTVGVMDGKVSISGLKAAKSGSDFSLKMGVGLDSLKLKSSRRIVLTPVIEGSDGQRVRLRPIVVNGRNQQIMYERRDHRSYDALNAYTVRRLNGTSQTTFEPNRSITRAEFAAISTRFAKLPSASVSFTVAERIQSA